LVIAGTGTAAIVGLVVGQVTRDVQTDDFVFRPAADAPETLLFADGSPDDLVQRLSRGTKRIQLIALVSVAMGVATAVLMAGAL
jgi:hypothetical protein